MNKQIIKFITFNLIALFLGVSATITHAQNRPYKVRDSQVQYILNRIETRTDTYRREMNSALDKSALNNTDREDLVLDYITDFENATDLLKQKFEAKESVVGDVEDVLTRAAYINRFMKDNQLSTRSQAYWRYLSTDLNTLARYYAITGDWRTVPVAQTGQKAYRVSDEQVKLLLTSIEARTDRFRRSLDRALDNSRLNGTDSEDAINKYVTEFENATDALKQKFEVNKSVNSDVQAVLNRAYFIDNFVKNNRLQRNAENNWTYLKSDLNTLAGYYNVSWNWTNPALNNTAYNVPAASVSDLLTRIESGTDIYKRYMNRALDQSILNNSKSEDAFVAYITEFENATDRLKQNFHARRSTTADVENVLDRAFYINSFMRDYRFQQDVERQWGLLRADLDKLQGFYSVSFDFENRRYSPPTAFDAMVTGTYRLNAAESDNVSVIVDNAIGNYPASRRDNLERNLERRLASPTVLAIEKRGENFTVAATDSPRMDYLADGVVRDLALNRNRTAKVTAKTFYDGVAVNVEGDRINDFYINYMPLGNNRLKVVRRVYLENQNQTVTVATIYDRVNQTAVWSDVNDGGTTAGNSLEAFIVPNNTPITAVLNTLITTKESKPGDKFTMTVNSPSQFAGALIEGRVAEAERSGRVSGRANLSLEFDTIRLSDGRVYRFAGFVEEVRMLNGDKVAVNNNEGTVRDSNQTTKTVTRTGIGAALGALIGAIANGGQGAAIGAIIGAGAGAGTVALEGRDDIQLDKGTEFTLTATAPEAKGSGR